MSKALATQQTTNISGYFNGNKWPLQVVISELNVTLNLKPGEFIQDVNGRKINDPFFDRYTRPLQLSKEIAQQAVPLIQVPRITHVPAPSSQHSVRSVEKFETDRHGVRRPVLTAPKAATPPPVNQPSVKAMSMEDARNLGFVGKVREVPEDYGAAESSGAPVSVDRVPPIRYAIESTPRVRTQGELPKELTTPEFADENGEIQQLDPNRAAVAQQLQQGLAKAANSNIVENPTGFLNESRVNPIVTPSGAPASHVLPPPNIPGAAAAGFSQAQVADAQPQAPVTAPAKAVKAKTAKKAAPAKAPAKPAEEERPFLCPIDGKRFRYRSQLKTHARRKYPERETELLAPYPEQEQRGGQSQAETADQQQ